MAEELNAEEILNTILLLGNEWEIETGALRNFRRWYRFYQQLENPEPVLDGASLEKDQDATFEDANRESYDNPAYPPVPLPAAMVEHLRQQAIQRKRYGQQPDYYLLLKSFYNAFVFPLEQDLFIARTCQALEIGQVALWVRDETQSIPVGTYSLSRAAATLEQVTVAFSELGNFLFPDRFSLDDFTSSPAQGV
jgi:hypothetical protein